MIEIEKKKKKKNLDVGLHGPLALMTIDDRERKKNAIIDLKIKKCSEVL
jgi:hypothetical protein